MKDSFSVRYYDEPRQSGYNRENVVGIENARYAADQMLRNAIAYNPDMIVLIRNQFTDEIVEERSIESLSPIRQLRK